MDCERCGTLLDSDEGICPTCGTIYGKATSFAIPVLTREQIASAREQRASGTQPGVDAHRKPAAMAPVEEPAPGAALQHAEEPVSVDFSEDVTLPEGPDLDDDERQELEQMDVPQTVPSPAVVRPALPLEGTPALSSPKPKAGGGRALILVALVVLLLAGVMVALVLL